MNGKWSFGIGMGILLALLVGSFLSLDSATRSHMLQEFKESTIVALVITALFVLPLTFFIVWWEKRHPTPQCPTCRQDLPRDKEYLATKEQNS